jgi:ankyrin repeat protein
MSSAYTIDDLIDAAMQGNIEQVRACLDMKVNPNLANTAGDTPLIWAAQGGHIEIVNLLLAAGADPNAIPARWPAPPLIYAAIYGHLEVVKALLKANANPNLANIDGSTALYNAVYWAMTYCTHD